MLFLCCCRVTGSPPRFKMSRASSIPPKCPLNLAAVQIIPTKALLLLLRLKLNNEEPSYLTDPLCVPVLLGLLRPAEQDWGPCTQWKGNLMEPEMAAAWTLVLQVKSVLKDACSLKAFFFFFPQFKDVYSKLVSYLSSHPRLLFFTKTQTYVFIHIHTYICQHFL